MAYFNNISKVEYEGTNQPTLMLLNFIIRQK